MKDIDRFLDSFSGCRILVVGDVMLDEYCRGHVERISPEAPVPILTLVGRDFSLGGAANVGTNLRALGAKVALVGIVGRDETGEQITELLEAAGVGTSLVVDPRRGSTRKVRFVSLDHGQQVFRADEESRRPVEDIIEDRIVDLVREAASSVQVILCSDYMKGVLTSRVLQATFSAGREHGIPVIVAPKDVHPEKYQGASILMLNLRELSLLVGMPADGSEWLTDSGRSLTHRLQLEALLVTRGRDGMSLFEPAGSDLRRLDIPTVARNVYDVTGAGDTALAVFAAALGSGADRESATQLANIAAGIVVGKRGTASVTAEEIREHFADQGHQSRGTGETELLLRVASGK